jgi:hypothetical protein
MNRNPLLLTQHGIYIKGRLSVSNNLFMNNTTAAAKRQIFSSYYNFYATSIVGTLTYSGRFYGDLNSIVYDCPDTRSLGSSNHVFYCYNNADPFHTLTISNTGITNNTTQPASNDSSTIVPTTAWVQSAISAKSAISVINSNINLTTPLSNIYTIASGPITITLPTGLSYSGSTIIFRRISGSGTITFQSSGNNMIKYDSVSAALNIPMTTQNSTCFIYNGINWIQLYMQ